MKQILIKRGDIFWVNFDPSKATEIQKTCPAVILSHDIMNENSSRVIVAPITSNVKKVYSFEYKVSLKAISGKIMLDQLRAIDKIRLGDRAGTLTIKEINEIETSIKFVLGL